MENSVLNYLESVLKNVPSSWIKLTTHRLDIYNESLAKTQFIDQFEKLYESNKSDETSLIGLPTAYDYIRLGHPLSSVLEWYVAKQNNIKPERVISFESTTIPIMAIFRKNLLNKKETRIVHSDGLPKSFDQDLLRSVYGYQFEIVHTKDIGGIQKFDGSTIYISSQSDITSYQKNETIDFTLNIHDPFGSVIIVNGEKNEDYISEIQHVRRRESVAMTPMNCQKVLSMLTGQSLNQTSDENQTKLNGESVVNSIREITDTKARGLVGSSGLSVQYAIMMGLVQHGLENHLDKPIKFIVPPNCYGGTNDQARRVAACIDNVEIVDLAVDGGNDMVQSLEAILTEIAHQDGIPYIIAEIPTNPRVEVPDLMNLKEVLGKNRLTDDGKEAVPPVFVLDQTFCPNFNFLGKGKTLSEVQAISYVSGSKFPSGGLCTAGYCVANEMTAPLLEKIERHLKLCENEANELQMEILAQQLPSMKQRIYEAYLNTREFTDYIQEILPESKINFVSKELADEGFTPSVFSLDLPTKGETNEEKETYKRAQNLRLINLMICKIPNESKYCVSYGQLNGCYWTIPATSTQGTTKEADKDYIARVALSPNMDLERHKEVFKEFVAGI